MSKREDSERTVGGIVGRVVGKAKEAVAALSGQRHLAREGRLQQAQADAGLDAAKHARAAYERETDARLGLQKIETTRERERLQAEQQAERERLAAQEQIKREQAAAAEETARLEQEASRAEQNAQAIDPEEHR